MPTEPLWRTRWTEVEHGYERPAVGGGAAWYPLGAVVGFDDYWDRPSSIGGCAMASCVGSHQRWKVAPWMTKAPCGNDHMVCVEDTISGQGW